MANKPTRGWRPPNWASLSKEMRQTLDSLSDFLAHPYFYNGIEVGDGTPPTRDQDGVVTEPELRTIDFDVTLLPEVDSIGAEHFQNVIALNVGKVIKSAFYSPLSSGWAIDGNGSAEFNNITIRNAVQAGGSITGTVFRTNTSGARVEIDQSEIDRIKFYNASNQVQVALGAIDGNAALLCQGALFVRNAANTAAATIDCGAVVLPFNNVVLSGSDVTAQGTVTGNIGSFNNIDVWAIASAPSPFHVALNGTRLVIDSSSREWKREIKDASLVKRKVLGLRPRRYKAADTDDDREMVGLIFEEAKAIDPAFVAEDTERGFKVIDWNAITMALLAEVADLRADVDALTDPTPTP